MTDDFPGNDEVEILLLDPLLRLVHHENLAVQAGVQIGAVAVARVDDDILVFLDHVDDVQLDAELFGNPQRIVALGPAAIASANRMRVALDAKSGEEIDPLDFDSLALNQFCRQQ